MSREGSFFVYIQMNQLDIWFLAVALAMDCFTVSIAGGIIIKRMVWPITLRMALLFGLFQAAMPLLGWLGISTFSHYLEEVDHWIAFGLLTFLGGRMIRDAFLPAENHSLNPCKLKTQLLLALATSIDALAIGISCLHGLPPYINAHVSSCHHRPCVISACHCRHVAWCQVWKTD